MCVTVLASQPSESIPTEMTFCIVLTRLSRSSHCIHHLSATARPSGLLVSLGPTAAVVRFVLHRPTHDLGYRFLGLLRPLQNAGVDVQRTVRSSSQSSSMENSLAVKGVLDPGRSLGPVGDSDHHRRGLELGFLATLWRPLSSHSQAGSIHWSLGQATVHGAGHGGSGRPSPPGHYRCGRGATCRSWHRGPVCRPEPRPSAS